MEAQQATTDEAQNEIKAIEGWTLTADYGNKLFFDNDTDGATVSVEPYDNYNSNADYVVKSDYIGVNCVMGRVRACVTLEEAVDVATEHMKNKN